MENKKDAGKEQRVVLNLNLEQANDLLNLFHTVGLANREMPIAGKLAVRLHRTIIKYRISADHPEFTKDQVNSAIREVLR
jgi:predicted Zn-dependent protease with MMP-like domain